MTGLIILICLPILWQVPRTFWPVRLNPSGTRFTGLYRRYSIATFTGYASAVRTWTETRTHGSVRGHTSGVVSGGGVTATTTVSDNRRTFTTYHTGFFLTDQTGATRDVDAANVGPSVAEGHLVSAAWLVHNGKQGNAFLVYNHTSNTCYLEITSRGGMSAHRGLNKMVFKLPLAYQVLLLVLIITIPVIAVFAIGSQVQLKLFSKRGVRPLMAALERSAAEVPQRVAAASLDAGGNGDFTSQMKEITALYDSGSLSAEEFQMAKAKLLGSPARP
jgi:hypothetical protein